MTSCIAEVPGYGRSIDLGKDPSKVCMQRWMGRLSPEPETCKWIDSLPKGKVFFDVGANVGTFSVRACLHGMQVVAFEPALEHFVELCGIIERNKLPILALNVALHGSRTQIGGLGKGRSTHTLFTAPFLGRPGVVATTMDQMVEWLGGTFPEYVKLDVDGNEYQILQGAQWCLNSYIKAILVEIDPHIGEHHAIVRHMNKRDFYHDERQVEACRIVGGKYDGMANYIFERSNPDA